MGQFDSPKYVDVHRRWGQHWSQPVATEHSSTAHGSCTEQASPLSVKRPLRQRRRSPALPNPDFPLVRVGFLQRFQVRTGFRIEDQDRLVVDEELDI